MLQTLIFDWDGTLHDTKALYGRAFRRGYAWLTEKSYAPKRDFTDAELSVYLGMSAPDMWNAFMPQLPQAVKKHVSALIGAAMTDEIRSGHASLYPGIHEILTSLRRQGYSLVFLSNCKHAYMETHRAYFALDQYFQGYFCCEDYDFVPKTEIFSSIAKRFPGDYCMIGDRAGDLEVALRHGFPGIGCAYGFGTAEELTGASLIAHSPSQLPELICRLNQTKQATG